LNCISPFHLSSPLSNFESIDLRANAAKVDNSLCKSWSKFLNRDRTWRGFCTYQKVEAELPRKEV
jgi:hypothetical protein